MAQSIVSREELLENAYQIAERNGVSALSVRGLANAAGVSVGTVYRHFLAKDELYFKHAFYERFCHIDPQVGFVDYCREMHASMREVTTHFREYWLRGIDALPAVEKAAAANKPAEDATEGTVEDMREYVIEQIVRSELVQREIKNRKIEIADEEVDACVEQQRAYVEARLMEGVFESVLQRQGYKDLDEYREGIREQLKQLKLQNDVSTITTDDGQEISGKAAWSIWFDKLYEDAHVKINPAPQPLSYAIVEVADVPADDTAAGE